MLKLRTSAVCILGIACLLSLRTNSVGRTLSMAELTTREGALLNAGRGEANCSTATNTLCGAAFTGCLEDGDPCALCGTLGAGPGFNEAYYFNIQQASGTNNYSQNGNTPQNCGNYWLGICNGYSGGTGDCRYLTLDSGYACCFSAYNVEKQPGR
jgi:hypothetical protein